MYYFACCLIPSGEETVSSKSQSTWSMVQDTGHLPSEKHEELIRINEANINMMYYSVMKVLT